MENLRCDYRWQLPPVCSPRPADHRPFSSLSDRFSRFSSPNYSITGSYSSEDDDWLLQSEPRFKGHSKSETLVVTCDCEPRDDIILNIGGRAITLAAFLREAKHMSMSKATSTDDPQSFRPPSPPPPPPDNFYFEDNGEGGNDWQSMPSRNEEDPLDLKGSHMSRLVDETLLSGMKEVSFDEEYAGSEDNPIVVEVSSEDEIRVVTEVEETNDTDLRIVREMSSHENSRKRRRSESRSHQDETKHERRRRNSSGHKDRHSEKVSSKEKHRHTESSSRGSSKSRSSHEKSREKRKSGEKRSKTLEGTKTKTTDCVSKAIDSVDEEKGFNVDKENLVVKSSDSLKDKDSNVADQDQQNLALLKKLKDKKRLCKEGGISGNKNEKSRSERRGSSKRRARIDSGPKETIQLEKKITGDLVPEYYMSKSAASAEASVSPASKTQKTAHENTKPTKVDSGAKAATQEKKGPEHHVGSKAVANMNAGNEVNAKKTLHEPRKRTRVDSGSKVVTQEKKISENHVPKNKETKVSTESSANKTVHEPTKRTRVDSGTKGTTQEKNISVSKSDKANVNTGTESDAKKTLHEHRKRTRVDTGSKEVTQEKNISENHVPKNKQTKVPTESYANKTMHEPTKRTRVDSGTKETTKEKTIFVSRSDKAKVVTGTENFAKKTLHEPRKRTRVDSGTKEVTQEEKDHESQESKGEIGKVISNNESTANKTVHEPTKRTRVDSGTKESTHEKEVLETKNKAAKVRTSSESNVKKTLHDPSKRTRVDSGSEIPTQKDKVENDKILMSPDGKNEGNVDGTTKVTGKKKIPLAEYMKQKTPTKDSSAKRKRVSLDRDPEELKKNVAANVAKSLTKVTDVKGGDLLGSLLSNMTEPRDSPRDCYVPTPKKKPGAKNMTPSNERQLSPPKHSLDINLDILGNQNELLDLDDFGGGKKGEGEMQVVPEMDFDEMVDEEGDDEMITLGECDQETPGGPAHGNDSVCYDSLVTDIIENENPCTVEPAIIPLTPVTINLFDPRLQRRCSSSSSIKPPHLLTSTQEERTGGGPGQSKSLEEHLLAKSGVGGSEVESGGTTPTTPCQDEHGEGLSLKFFSSQSPPKSSRGPIILGKLHWNVEQQPERPPVVPASTPRDPRTGATSPPSQHPIISTTHKAVSEDAPRIKDPRLLSPHPFVIEQKRSLYVGEYILRKIDFPLARLPEVAYTAKPEIIDEFKPPEVGDKTKPVKKFHTRTLLMGKEVPARIIPHTPVHLVKPLDSRRQPRIPPVDPRIPFYCRKKRAEEKEMDEMVDSILKL